MFSAIECSESYLCCIELKQQKNVMWSVNVRARKVKFFKNLHFGFRKPCLKDEKIDIKSIFFFFLHLNVDLLECGQKVF